MKSFPVTISIPAFTITCDAIAGVEKEPVFAPAEDCPELKILNQYAGIWVEGVSGKPEVRRRAVGEWILDGRFMRQTWTSEAHDDMSKASGMTLMTFDRERRAYLSWAFLATGSVIENDGAWDAKSGTLTWSHRAPETSDVIVTKVSFPDGLVQEWSIVKSDAEGKVLKELSGRSVRQVAGE